MSKFKINILYGNEELDEIFIKILKKELNKICGK